MTVEAKLDRSFFFQDPVSCARALVGSVLVWEECSGRVVETEAYTERDAPACHTFLRPSARRFIEEYAPCTAYVYCNLNPAL